MSQDKDLFQGTLALMILKKLQVREKLHGCGIARRIEQIGRNQLFPVLDPPSRTSQTGTARIHRLHVGNLGEQSESSILQAHGGPDGKQDENQLQRWETASEILTRFLSQGREAI
jgi:hypothetical protein